MAVDNKKLDRLKDAVRSGEEFTGQKADNINFLNPKFGGQWGFAPSIGRKESNGELKAEWVSNQAYVPRDIDVQVIQYPKFMDWMENPILWKSTFKSMMETHAEIVEGLNSELTLETEDNALGGSGAEFMDEPTDAKIARSSPSFTWTEKLGRPFQRFLTAYISYGILDPHTKTARIVSVSPLRTELRSKFRKGLYTADYYSFTLLYTESDVTMSHVVDAWLHCGGFPKSAGERTGKSDKAGGKSIRKLTIEMAGFCLNTPEVHVFAQEQLDKRTVRDVRPLKDMSTDKVDAGLLDSSKTPGYNNAGGNLNVGE